MKRMALAVALLVSLAAPAVAGFAEGVAAYERGDLRTAVREFKLLAVRGDVIAQIFLGAMYYEGRGVPQNDALAVKWFRRGAVRGYAEAQCTLGRMYGLG